MKIIITERQQNLISENMTEENLRKFCYSIWDKQKKMGEQPHLDDIIYDISVIKKTQPKILQQSDLFGIDIMVDLIIYMEN
jgi:hypothetical protein